MSLLVGLAVGWCFEHYRAEREKTEIIQEMVDGTESCDIERAGRAVRAIQMIDSGGTQEAVQLLSGAVAHFYGVYGDRGGKNQQRRKLLTQIHELARTNRIVATRIQELTAGGDKTR